MNKITMTAVALGLGSACLGFTALRHGENTKLTEGAVQESRAAHAKNKADDIDKLYELVRQARADLEALRVQAGIPQQRGEGRGEHAEGRREGRGEHAEGGREGRGEHAEGGREGRGEHAEGRREGRGEHAEGGREGRGEHAEGRREGRGEHAEGGREGRGESGDEEGGKRLRKHQGWNETRNGAHLRLAYDAASQSFKGTVQNTTSRTLSEVRVEVHLSNGVELGPTKRNDLRPGAEMAVELSASDQEFTWWTTHPEHGSEEGHGPGHEGERGGEHGEGDGSRPSDPDLRPLYNQIQLLRSEIKMIARGIESRRRR